MDSGDGRDRRIAKPTSPIVFSLPYSGDEILLLFTHDKGYVGVSYNPTKMTPPTPWSAECVHCRQGRQVGLDIHLKRAIKVLCSRKIVDGVEIYQIPTNNDPCKLLCSRENGELDLKLLLSSDHSVDLHWKKGKIESKWKDLPTHSKILDRTLRFLSSARTVSRKEVVACLKPQLEKQRRDGMNAHLRHPCLKIDWSAVVGSR